MNNLTLEQLNKVRKKGLRPQVVGCFINQKKVLFVYKKEHNLWQIPQGGVDNNETLYQALEREMIEELGVDFVEQADNEYTLIGQGQLNFPKQFQGSRELKTDKGRGIVMKGKKYYFFVIKTKNKEINLSKTEFDESKWCDYAHAMKLINLIYQKGKKRITLTTLNKLKEFKYI